MENKIVEKIKKLLELAASPNENEASRAMELAQNLMAKYSVDLGDLESDTELRSKIITKEYLNIDLFKRQGVFERLPEILAIIPPIFGVYGIIRNHRNVRSPYLPSQATYELVGFETNVNMVIYALDSLLNQGLADARKEYSKFRTTTFGVGFWQGFAIGLSRKFGKFTTESEGIVIYDKVREYLKSITDKTYEAPRASGVAIQTGIESGLKAEIRRGLDTTNKGNLLK